MRFRWKKKDETERQVHLEKNESRGDKKRTRRDEEGRQDEIGEIGGPRVDRCWVSGRDFHYIQFPFYPYGPAISTMNYPNKQFLLSIQLLRAVLSLFVSTQNDISKKKKEKRLRSADAAVGGAHINMPPWPSQEIWSAVLFMVIFSGSYK